MAQQANKISENQKSQVKKSSQIKALAKQARNLTPELFSEYLVKSVGEIMPNLNTPAGHQAMIGQYIADKLVPFLHKKIPPTVKRTEDDDGNVNHQQQELPPMPWNLKKVFDCRNNVDSVDRDSFVDLVLNYPDLQQVLHVVEEDDGGLHFCSQQAINNAIQTNEIGDEFEIQMHIKQDVPGLDFAAAFEIFVQFCTENYSFDEVDVSKLDPEVKKNIPEAIYDKILLHAVHAKGSENVGKFEAQGNNQIPDLSLRTEEKFICNKEVNDSRATANAAIQFLGIFPDNIGRLNPSEENARATLDTCMAASFYLVTTEALQSEAAKRSNYWGDSYLLNQANSDLGNAITAVNFIAAQSQLADYFKDWPKRKAEMKIQLKKYLDNEATRGDVKALLSIEFDDNKQKNNENKEKNDEKSKPKASEQTPANEPTPASNRDLQLFHAFQDQEDEEGGDLSDVLKVHMNRFAIANTLQNITNIRMNAIIQYSIANTRATFDEKMEFADTMERTAALEQLDSLFMCYPRVFCPMPDAAAGACIADFVQLYHLVADEMVGHRVLLNFVKIMSKNMGTDRNEDDLITTLGELERKNPYRNEKGRKTRFHLKSLELVAPPAGNESGSRRERGGEDSSGQQPTPTNNANNQHSTMMMMQDGSQQG